MNWGRNWISQKCLMAVMQSRWCSCHLRRGCKAPQSCVGYRCKAPESRVGCAKCATLSFRNLSCSCKGIRSLLWQIGTISHVLALLLNATKHGNQKSKEVVEILIVPMLLQGLTIQLPELPSWHVAFLYNSWNTRWANRWSWVVQHIYWPENRNCVQLLLCQILYLYKRTIYSGNQIISLPSCCTHNQNERKPLSAHVSQKWQSNRGSIRSKSTR